jgi:hypothetical protein
VCDDVWVFLFSGISVEIEGESEQDRPSYLARLVTDYFPVVVGMIW